MIYFYAGQTISWDDFELSGDYVTFTNERRVPLVSGMSGKFTNWTLPDQTKAGRYTAWWSEGGSEEFDIFLNTQYTNPLYHDKVVDKYHNEHFNSLIVRLGDIDDISLSEIVVGIYNTAFTHVVVNFVDTAVINRFQTFAPDMRIGADLTRIHTDNQVPAGLEHAYYTLSGQTDPTLFERVYDYVISQHDLDFYVVSDTVTANWVKDHEKYLIVKHSGLTTDYPAIYCPGQTQALYEALVMSGVYPWTEDYVIGLRLACGTYENDAAYYQENNIYMCTDHEDTYYA